MPKIEIVEGRYYRGKTSLLRKVLSASPEGIRWHDRVGPGKCTAATFRSWLRTEVTDEADPEIAQVEAAIVQADRDNVNVFKEMSVVMEDLYADNEITVWNDLIQLPYVMLKFYTDAWGRKEGIRWICWVPKRKSVPAFCLGEGLETYEVEDKGAFHVRTEATTRRELVDWVFSSGRDLRMEGSDPVAFDAFREAVLKLGADDHPRMIASLYNVWVAGYNSAGLRSEDEDFLSGRGREAR
jgi:hypothetical protein